MNIGVVGGGAVGLLTASYLIEMGHKVTLYVRSETQAVHIREFGGSRDRKQFYVDEVRVSTNFKDEDFMMLCVKTIALEEVLSSIIEQAPNTPLLFLCNGMAHIRMMEELTQPVYAGVVEHGVLRTGIGSVVHRGVGRIRFAPVNELDQRFIQQLVGNEMKCFKFEQSEDYRSLLTEKLIVNATVNPLTALFKVKNGQLLNSPHLHQLARMVCEECCGILGVSMDSMWTYVQSVIRQTANNESSMLKDIRHERKTELDAITGYLCAEAAAKGFPSPINTFLYNAIKELELN
ncbi:2-dehydropantoate 2-reductase [Pontibacillus halophilus JSM 076056 = DSM 19796]|uniref:2-dehydropantoate 2-reductase n=1 Tax=Pontibacillus halophilus JSM 076056 = DSM 19796 TaxID=1385510 RepID=A0A0A5IBQ3_9BACI|nr:2-dehydropantoate 2-reductase [Pontibacillus halophilus]KGX93272.1 2-dehydropantoate 2-reductase [Pontibacillus halophilus JSM 076056 = DSM 19796]